MSSSTMLMFEDYPSGTDSLSLVKLFQHLCSLEYLLDIDKEANHSNKMEGFRNCISLYFPWLLEFMAF